MQTHIRLIAVFLLVSAGVGCSDETVDNHAATNDAQIDATADARPDTTNASTADSRADGSASDIPVSAGDVRRISAAELRSELDAGRAVVVDVRSAKEYTTRHIAGASSIPLDEIEARGEELPRDKLIATYCS